MRKIHQFGEPGFRHVMLCDPEEGIDDYGQADCDACGQGFCVTAVVREVPTPGNRFCPACGEDMNAKSKMAWFRIVKRVIGPGWQVRIRTFDGQEDTVDILSTLDEARRTWDRMNEGMIPLTERPVAVSK